jgi:hypothetical protein
VFTKTEPQEGPLAAERLSIEKLDRPAASSQGRAPPGPVREEKEEPEVPVRDQVAAVWVLDLASQFLLEGYGLNRRVVCVIFWPASQLNHGTRN